MTDRPQKITFAEMREMGVRGLLIYCADYRCSHSIAISGDQWADDVRLSDIVCRSCGQRGADVRPDFNWNRTSPRDGLLLKLNSPLTATKSPGRCRGFQFSSGGDQYLPMPGPVQLKR
jgi:hypothetical protein